MSDGFYTSMLVSGITIGMELRGFFAATRR
jgi:hypothetical protein